MHDAYRIFTSLGLVEHAFPVLFYWEIEMRPGAPAAHQHVLPSVYMDMIFPLEESIAMDDIGEVRSSPFFSTILRAGIKLTFARNMRLFGIRIDSVYFDRLIEASPKDLVEGPNGFDTIGPKALARQLTVIVESGRNFVTRVRRVNAFIGQRCFLNCNMEKAICRAALAYIRDNPQAKARELSKLTGYSPRWVEKLFRENLGASPQEMIRITRFNRFLTLLQNGKFSNLTELVYQCGYYDQSHMIRDFHSFSPGSPRDLTRHIPLLTRVMNKLHV